MKIKSKTQLVEHILELVQKGYLIEQKKYSDEGRNSFIETYYTLNFASVEST